MADRIVYLAVADARGHLMRAHLLRGLLAEVGIELDVVTTQRDGQRFLAEVGTPSRLLSEHFRVEFGERHDMSRARTTARVARYLLSPDRALRDLRELERLAQGALFVVDDSLHPALLLAAALRRPVRIVHVHGENLWLAAEEYLPSKRWRQALRAARDVSFGCIVHALAGVDARGPRQFRLPPLVAGPRRARDEVREGADRFAAVYLNPHFRDPRIAAAIERVLSGHALHAVGEGYADRAGWRARDKDFADALFAADVFVSGAGMGALAQARASGVPMIVLLGDQPEQERNAAQLPRDRFQTVRASSPTLEADLTAALSRLSRGAPAGGDASSLWKSAFLQLTEEAKREIDPGPGDEQPARRQRFGKEGGGRSGAPSRPAA